MDESLLVRFAAKVKSSPDGCWLWTASQDGGGYGILGVKEGKKMPMRKAHRVSYVLFVGPIPDGLDLDHLCRVRHCVNPDHLEPVTRTVNIRRGLQPGHRDSQTHCKQGHPLSGDNLVRTKTQRVCRICRNARALAYYHRQRSSSGDIQGCGL
jgi:hypothetical protein